MKARLRQAVVAVVPSAWLGFLGRGGLAVLMLFTLIPPMGCRDGDEKTRQETTDAKAAAARLELSLAAAKRENDSLRDELKAVKQTRDNLQEQMDQIGQERDQAAMLARQANDAIAQLTARAEGQMGAAVTLQKQVDELKALVKEQQAVIDELQKTGTTQPAAGETSVDAVSDEIPLADPNAIP